MAEAIPRDARVELRGWVTVELPEDYTGPLYVWDSDRDQFVPIEESQPTFWEIEFARMVARDLGPEFVSPLRKVPADVLEAASTPVPAPDPAPELNGPTDWPQRLIVTSSLEEPASCSQA